MQEVFGSIGFNEKVKEETFSITEHYVCTIYGKPKLKTVNVNSDIFLKKYNSKSKDEVINCVARLDGSTLPSCSRVLWKKRFMYQLYSRKMAICLATTST